MQLFPNLFYDEINGHSKEYLLTVPETSVPYFVNAGLASWKILKTLIPNFQLTILR